jgi:uncharacterized protein (DUF885 family)
MAFVGAAMSLVVLATSGDNVIAQTAATPSAADATRALRDFLARDWAYWMHEYPEEATFVGYPGENGRWTDYSPASVAGRNAHLRDALNALKAIPRDALPATEQLNDDLYDELLRTTIEGLRFHDDAFPIAGEFPMNLYVPISQMWGPQQSIPLVIATMPAARRSDYDDILARLTGIPVVIDQTIDQNERRDGPRVDAGADHDAGRAEAGRESGGVRPTGQPAARRVQEVSGDVRRG